MLGRLTFRLTPATNYGVNRLRLLPPIDKTVNHRQLTLMQFQRPLDMQTLNDNFYAKHEYGTRTLHGCNQRLQPARSP